MSEALHIQIFNNLLEGYWAQCRGIVKRFFDNCLCWFHSIKSTLTLTKSLVLLLRRATNAYNFLLFFCGINR